MLGCVLELAQEDVRIAQVRVGSSLGRLVPRFARDRQSLRVVADGSCEVAQQVASVAEIAASPPRSLPVVQGAHQLQILSEIWYMSLLYLVVY